MYTGISCQTHLDASTQTSADISCKTNAGISADEAVNIPSPFPNARLTPWLSDTSGKTMGRSLMKY